MPDLLTIVLSLDMLAIPTLLLQKDASRSILI